MFTILIGSVARGDHTHNSDIDICRINSYEEITVLDCKSPPGPTNYIDYSFDQFMSLYMKGSLFIFHIFKEGILLKGDIEDWNNYKNNFIIKTSFYEEITNLKNSLKLIMATEIFGGKYLSLYSNFFTIIKNISIFALANNGIYEFNKKNAICKIYGEYFIDFLIDSYSTFERGVSITDHDYDSPDILKHVLDYYIPRTKEL